MKFKLELKKTYEIDTDTHWSGDLDYLIDKLRENGVEGTANYNQIGDAIGDLLEDDLEAVLGDPDLSHTDFTVVVPPGTTLEVPSEDEDD